MRILWGAHLPGQIGQSMRTSSTLTQPQLIKKIARLALILVSIIWVASSRNLLLTWIFIEINSIGFILIAHSKERKEAMLVYFATQAIASTLILMQISIEKTTFWRGGRAISQRGDILVTISIAIKIGAPPLHHWVVRASSFLPWGNLFVLLTAQRGAPLAVLIQITSKKVMIALAVARAIVGVFSQLGTRKIKIILVYSSISHRGWIIALTRLKLLRVTWYLAIYRAVRAALFRACHKIKANNLRDQGNTKSTPAIVVHLISLAGIPPFIGFSMKWIVLSALFPLEGFVAIIGLIATLTTLNTYAYARIITGARLKGPNMSEVKKLKVNKPLGLVGQIAPTIPILSLIRG